MRGRKRKGTRYFGPYAHAYAIRDTLDLLLRSFPIRTCSPGKFNEHHRLGRPCLLFHIEKCSGPCVGEIEEMPYRQLVHELCEFLDGDTDDIVRRLEADMANAASELGVRARGAAARPAHRRAASAIEKQQMVADRSEDIDVVGIADDELEAAVQVFFVRKGRVVGRKGFILDKVEELSPGGLVDRILEELYGDEPPAGVPKQVLVPVEPDDLADLRGVAHAPARQPKVQIRVPQRGDKRELHETVTRNAREEFVRHRMRRAGDHNARSRALTELQDLLGLPEAPLRIECYDMAHLQGTDYVGSMVVLEDGLPNKREYRRFKVKDVPGNDDYAAMEEVLTRRLQAYLNERDQPLDDDRWTARVASGRQVRLPAAAAAGRRRQGSAVGGAPGGHRARACRTRSPIASLAKRFEEVYLPGRSEPVEVPRGSDGLFMLQRIRDEAHRFANTFHRELRGKRMTTSALDGIPGLGEARKKKLTQVMGGVNAVKKASLDDLKALSFLPDAVAEAIHTKFHQQ
jgi:excinuclease ABC subunit C